MTGTKRRLNQNLAFICKVEVSLLLTNIDLCLDCYAPTILGPTRLEHGITGAGGGVDGGGSRGGHICRCTYVCRPSVMTLVSLPVRD